MEQLPDVVVEADDWPWWRGPNRDGIADDTPVPITWSETENVVWKAPVPGRGNSTPSLVGARIFLATADQSQQTQSVLAYDRESGKQLWQTEIHRGNLPSSGMHRETTHAACTVACDGERLFVAFLNGGAIWTTALDVDGQQLWQTNAGPFHPTFGYAPSPVIYQSLVIIAGDHRDGGFLAALHRKTGEVRWRVARPAVPTFASPVVANVAGKDQLLISGANQVDSYDPDTGKEFWSVSGTAESTCGTIVVQDDVVFASGGYPESDTLCIKADGSGDVLWRIDDKAYVPSLLLDHGSLYAIDGERGVAYCLDAATGAEKWKKRLQPKFRASPLLAGRHIYMTNARGTTYVIKANSDRYEEVAQNQLGDETYATPVAVGGRLYIRAADSSSGTRQEMLYCIGTTAAAVPGEAVEAGSE